MKILQQRIAELNAFVKLGKSRVTEVLAAEADLADARATRAGILSFLAETRELLGFLTGWPTERLDIELPRVPGAALSLDHYLSRGATRADFKALVLRTDAAQFDRTVRARAGWPALRLEGSSYPFEDPDRNREWDLALRLDVPLYTAGRIDADIAEAEAFIRQRKLSADEQQRTITRDIKQSHAKLTGAVAERGELQSLKSITKRNLEALRKDYTDGLVTNLEVLEAIRRVQDTERRLLAIDATIGQSLAALEVAAGGVAP